MGNLRNGASAEELLALGLDIPTFSSSIVQPEALRLTSPAAGAYDVNITTY